MSSNYCRRSDCYTEANFQMITGGQPSRIARNRIAAFLLLLCVALAPCAPDLVPATPGAQSCCRRDHACCCHRHSSNGQPSWSSVPKCLDDCNRQARAEGQKTGITQALLPFAIELSTRDILVRYQPQRIKLHLDTSLWQRPPPTNS